MSIYDKASLVLIPSGTKTSKVYSQKPVSGDGDFTFSRSTAATRVNASGNIEKETQNLLLQSNSFDTTWTNFNSNETDGQSGYDGTSDAWLLTKTGTNGNINQVVSSSGVTTFSVYAKSQASDWIFIRIGSPALHEVYFDIANGVIGSETNVIDSNIEAAGNGYYRCSVTANVSSGSYVRFYVADSDGVTSGTSGSIYIQDAQLEQGLVARDYIETTTTAVEGGITDNVPRLDYTDSSCPALLLEPQRTNTFLTSEWFGIWDLNAGTALTYNYAISPEGVQNATRYVGTGASGFGDKFTLINGTQYTISAYVKSNTGATQYCRLIGDSSNISSDLEVTAEWTRIDYTWTSAGLTSKTNGIFRDSSNNDIDILVYGLQLEAGSYATSYIPTYGSAVTRNAEAALKTGVADLINDGEGSLYMEVTPTNFEGDQRFGISDNIGANRIVLRLYNPSNLQLSCVINSSVEVSIANSGYSAGNTYKIAGAWKDNDAVIYVNGVQVATDTNSNITPSNPLTRISFDNGVGTAKWENPVSQTMYFPTRLSNEELATLTTI